MSWSSSLTITYSTFFYELRLQKAKSDMSVWTKGRRNPLLHSSNRKVSAESNYTFLVQNQISRYLRVLLCSVYLLHFYIQSGCKLLFWREELKWKDSLVQFRLNGSMCKNPLSKVLTNAELQKNMTEFSLTAVRNKHFCNFQFCFSQQEGLFL